MSQVPVFSATVEGQRVRPGPFVPLWGLAVDGLVIVALVLSIARASRYWLDFFHVFGGALWISTDLLMGFVIGPIMNRLDIPARMVFAKNLMTKMLVIMPTAVICTVAAGWQLALIDGFFSYPYGLRHGWILASLIVVAILSILAYTFLEPANISSPHRTSETGTQRLAHRQNDEAVSLHRRRPGSLAAQYRHHHGEAGDMMKEKPPYAGDTSNSPVIACITATVICCILAAGIMVAHFPGPSPLWGSILWVSVAAALTVVSAVLILTRRPFARKLFLTVAKWVFLYILALSGIGEYVLMLDGTTGAPLVVMTIILLLFLVNIPMLWGFSVARHERVPS